MGEAPRAESRQIGREEPVEQSAGQGSVALTKDLDNLLSFCIGRISTLPEDVVITAVQALAGFVQSCRQHGQPVRLEALNVLLEILDTWRGQNEDIPAESLEAMEEAVKYLLATTPQVAHSVPALVAQLVQIQASWRQPLLRALAFRTSSSLLRSAGICRCDLQLASAVQPSLAALSAAASTESHAARFALEVFSICLLAPLAEDPLGLPQPSAEQCAYVLAAAANVTQHIQRDAAAAEQGRWECGSAGSTTVLVEQTHLLQFFCALPKLLAASGSARQQFLDDLGDTVLHKLAAAGLGKCLQAYLQGGGASLDASTRNKAGLTPAEVASASGHDDVVAAIEAAAASPTKPGQVDGGATLPMLIQGLGGVARAMARASSMPLPPQSGPDTEPSDPHLPSLSWIGPDTGLHFTSQEDRLQNFETQAARAQQSLGRLSTASRASSEGWPPQPRQSADERRRILELALAGLGGTGSEGVASASGGDGEGDGDRAWASTYLQNPTGSLKVQNPFADFQEVQGRLDMQRNQRGLLPPTPLHVGSVGSVESRMPSLSGLRPNPPEKVAIGFGKSEFDDPAKGAKRAEDWESAAIPSTRMWLGNIAAHVTVRSLYEIFGTFGQLTDAAVFPARIGPLGYAFVNFLNLDDAARAHDALNNTSVPPLTGSKLLKIRYKPAQQPKSALEGLDNIGQHPSNHLWLGNLPTRPNKLAIEELFSQFGPVNSVRVFPGKTFAFVNFDSAAHAANAMRILDGRAWPTVSGNKPMVVRYQAGPALAPPLADPLGLRLPQLAGMAGLQQKPQPVAMPGLGALQRGVPPPPGTMPRGPGVPGLAEQLDPSKLPSLPMPQMQLQNSGLDLDALLPAINLSNRLNPNNQFYSRELADLYRTLTKAEKEALWADDRSQQQLLALQGKEHLPADLSFLGLQRQQPGILGSQLSAGCAMDPWANSNSLLGGQAASSWAYHMPIHSPMGSAGLRQNSLQGQASGSLGSTPPMSSGMLQHLPPSSLAEALSSLGVGSQSLNAQLLDISGSRGQ